MMISSSSPWTYLSLHLSSPMKPFEVRAAILDASGQFLGVFGSAVQADVLKVTKDNIAIVRLPSDKANTVWAALTLGNKFRMTAVDARPYLFQLNIKM